MIKIALGFIAGLGVAMMGAGAFWQIHEPKAEAAGGYEASDAYATASTGGKSAPAEIRMAGDVHVYDAGRIDVARESRERRYTDDGEYELTITKRSVSEAVEIWDCRERERGGRTFVDCVLLDSEEEGEAAFSDETGVGAMTE